MTARTTSVERNTNETQIAIVLNLDGKGESILQTGLPFFDHMLDQIARHGMFDLQIDAKGDLEIDAHHTVEDVGITLGQAFADVLGIHPGERREYSNFAGRGKVRVMKGKLANGDRNAYTGSSNKPSRDKEHAA